jgi:hypothetical protein
MYLDGKAYNSFKRILAGHAVSVYATGYESTRQQSPFPFEMNKF